MGTPGRGGVDSRIARDPTQRTPRVIGPLRHPKDSGNGESLRYSLSRPGLSTGVGPGESSTSAPFTSLSCGS